MATALFRGALFVVVTTSYMTILLMKEKDKIFVHGSLKIIVLLNLFKFVASQWFEFSKPMQTIQHCKQRRALLTLFDRRCVTRGQVSGTVWLLWYTLVGREAAKQMNYFL